MPKLTVVISQSQSKNPAKRELEENLMAALLMEDGIDVSIIPHLTDLSPSHTGLLYLSSVTGDMVVISWLYSRAAFWMLDRFGIKGSMGETELAVDDDEEDAEEEESREQGNTIGALNVPDRTIYTLDLRTHEHAQPYVEEIKRIAAEVNARPAPPSAAPFMVRRDALRSAPKMPEELPSFSPERLPSPPKRRWYPVIDYDRCTNCMECIDFCLFGVYGVDALDRIEVENQDNCKKGCPACSRVCPENAIIFPEYKTPGIAGANVGRNNGFKIDLSKLFGGMDAISIAAAERDGELLKDGRDAVGLSVGIPKRQHGKSDDGPKDDLDQLIDSLDELDL